MRSKTNVYKQKRAEMEDIRSELGVLARTEEILANQWNKLKQDIVSNLADTPSTMLMLRRREEVG